MSFQPHVGVRGDGLGAGRTAIAVGVDHYTHSGDTAALQGWLGRVRRL
ncbi:MAG TPA: hypothetical protein VFE49_02105 [Jiangellaceae bacterium]|nr:hypothetical protein [Jiangellaceae bacterium]